MRASRGSPCAVQLPFFLAPPYRLRPIVATPLHTVSSPLPSSCSPPLPPSQEQNAPCTYMRFCCFFLFVRVQDISSGPSLIRAVSVSDRSLYVHLHPAQASVRGASSSYCREKRMPIVLAVNSSGRLFPSMLVILPREKRVAHV